MRFMQPLLALGAFVADQDDLRTLVSVEIADDVRSPISVANHTNADHIAPWNYEWCIHWPEKEFLCEFLEPGCLPLDGVLLRREVARFAVSCGCEKTLAGRSQHQA